MGNGSILKEEIFTEPGAKITTDRIEKLQAYCATRKEHSKLNKSN